MPINIKNPSESTVGTLIPKLDPFGTRSLMDRIKSDGSASIVQLKMITDSLNQISRSMGKGLGLDHEIASPMRGLHSSWRELSMIGKHFAEIHRSDQFSLSTSALTSIRRNTESLLAMTATKDFLATVSTPNYLRAETASYLATFKPVFETENLFTSKDFLAKFALPSLPKTDWSSPTKRLFEGFQSTAVANTRLWEQLTSAVGSTDMVSSALLRRPAMELYTGARVLDRWLNDEVALVEAQPDLDEALEEDDLALAKRLAALDSTLVESLHGAIQAIEGERADWQRHAMTSLRELSTAVMHALAPDNAVLGSNPRAELHRGRPTRRARLTHIFSQRGEAMTGFFVVDIDEAVELFDSLNGVTHHRGQKPSGEHVLVLRQRAVSLLTAMLEAAGI